jgi:NADH-quinone oxidoreductase subunit N
MPEIWLVIGMCAVILVPFISRKSIGLPSLTALAALILAIGATCMTLMSDATQTTIFSGTLAIDFFSQFFKVMLLSFTAFIVVQWLVATREDGSPGDVPDFLCLLLGATMGMALMASANNLLMIFIATEAASFPSFALAGFRKHRRDGSEGSLKYVLFGAAASAISVYGMSLIYGTTGSLDLQAIAAVAHADGISPLLAMGLTGLFAGLAFKLSAVPVHFWCPDVFQGAPTEVTTFLSVASKGAAICLLVRVLMAFGAATALPGEETFTGIAVAVGLLGAATATWGNLVALHQSNIKRLLAYSSIAHAGYMIMGAAGIIATASDPQNPIAAAILFYLFVYMFMNLGAFTVAGVIAKATGSENIEDYTGMLRRSPVMAVMLSIFLLSLFGMPSLGGFMGKLLLAASLKDLGVGGMVLIVALLINTLLSLYYYLRPIYYMVLVQDKHNRPAVPLSPAAGVLMLMCSVVLFWTGILPGVVSETARYCAQIVTPTVKTAAATTIVAVEPEAADADTTLH